METITRSPQNARSLSATLAIAFVSLTVIVLLVSTILQLVSTLSSQQDAVISQQERVAEQAGRAVSSFIGGNISALETSARLEQPATKPQGEQREALERLLGLESAFRQVAFLDEQGVEKARVSRLPQSMSASLNGRLSPDAIAQIKSGKPYISAVSIDLESGEPLVMMAVPASNVLGDFQGILASEVNLKFMWDLVDRVEVGATGAAYVVDRQGTLLAYRDTSRVLKGENVGQLGEVQEFLNVETPETFLHLKRGIDGTTVASSFAPLGTPDWAVVTEQPWTEAYGSAIQNTLGTLGITLMMAALAALAGIFLARRLAVPLVDLTATATRITSGELNLQAPVQGPGEVAALATAFNSMTSELRQTLEGLEQRVTERTSELEASNARLEASSEQLQASNAELEASRNRLQAGNEELEKKTKQLERAYLEMQQNSAYLAALNETSIGLISRLDTHELLGAIVARAASLVGTEHGYIYLSEPGELEMRLRLGTGLYENLVGSRTRPGVGLAGTVWQTGEPLAVSDYQNWEHRLSGPQRAFIQSVIGVPLKAGDKVIGVIGLASTDANRRFGQNELNVANRFAQLATIAMENARLFEQTERRVVELSALNCISQIAATQRNLQNLLDQVGDQLASIFKVKNASIALYNREAGLVELPYVVIDGERTVVPPVPFGEGVASTILTTRQPLVLNENAPERANESGSKSRGPAAKSYLGVPIVAGEQAIGVLSVQSTEQEGLFGQDEVRLLSTIAATVGVAVQNIQLFERSEKSLRETERIAERERVTAEELQVLTRRLTGEGWKKYLDREPADLVVENTNPGLNGGHREIHAMTRAQETASLVISNSEQRSALALPIVLRGQVIGTVGLEDLDPDRTWSEDELSIVKEVTENVALALDNARLFTETRRRVTELDALNSISQAVTSELDLESLLNLIGDQLQAIFDVQNVYIALYDRAAQMISLPYFVNNNIPATVEPIAFGEGITSHIIRTRQPLVINNDAQEQLAKFGAKTVGDPARSFLGVPIIVGEEVTGVISIQSLAREGAFDQENVRLMETIAATVGAAIQNAQLYGAMQQEVVTRQRAEQEIMLSLREKEVLLKEIHHRVKNNLQIITSLLNLQSAQLKDPEAITVFRESQSRVRSMALIHEKLYQSKDLAHIDFDGYVRDLLVYLFRSYAANPDQIQTHIATRDMYLGIDTAIPCGLIISELVTNALKYAFPNGKRGELHVGLGPADDGHLTLLVQDNGVGFPQGFNWRQSDSLGLQLVSTLSAQLHGTIEVESMEGTSFKITFPG